VKHRQGLPYSGIALLVIAGIALATTAHALFAPSDNLSQLSDIASSWSKLVVFTAAIGLVTMAGLEAVKRLLPIRGFFLRTQLLILLRPTSTTVGSLAVSAITPHHTDGPVVITDPLAGQSLAWFDVPLEQLIAQIGVVAKTELDRWLFQVDATVVNAAAAAQRQSLLRAMLRDRFPQLPPQPKNDDERQHLEIDMRSELEIQLDRLQVELGSRWRRVLRYTSCIVAAGIAAGVLVGSGVATYVALEVGVATFFVGGFFAWLARDITAGIERWRS
jgi:hypothetical protein